MANYASQITWPSGTALGLVGNQLGWPSSYNTALSTAAVVAGIILMFLTYSAVVLEKSLLVSQQKLQHLHGHTGNRLTYLTPAEPYTVLPQRTFQTLAETTEGMVFPFRCSKYYPKWIRRCKSVWE
jgi:hypothetical protein